MLSQEHEIKTGDCAGMLDRLHKPELSVTCPRFHLFTGESELQPIFHLKNVIHNIFVS
jgi:hypothetical protein